MTQENEYINAHLEKETDQERLSGLELTWDSTTIRHMEMLGVSEGWKCLNVGAGFGSITRWLANQVGSQGKVVATDIRTELHHEMRENVEIRQHNILTDELENDYYDLVHCRALLEHLGEPEKALTNMVKALKPGGWILIEELDSLIYPSPDSNNPDSDLYYSWYNKGIPIFKRLGYMKVGFGRNVRLLVENLGFQEVNSEGIMTIGRGGEPIAKFQAMSYKSNWEFIRNELIEEEKQLGEEIEKDFDKIISLFENPSFYFVGIPLFCAWGRKPKQ
jgi:ubiquinone/menaquinone biosynthesis C-methylase UbiE